ncbi:Uu.00g038450.m01.CDS01 [Anthostomella pinea]|uniref:Uu.00g038450.m01.CDS01 n=1 Tax=Anthostomella pinea TaxID=933095 RepID=A0AAI8VAB7_9PEZI|nr:Uu.00g038450.m01.CDS01 [Anthostomella pinea]
MSPTTRQQSRQQDVEDESYETDSDSGFDFDEDSGIAIFPSNMKYSLHALDSGTKETVIKAMEPSSRLSLRACQARDQDFLFLISETVEYNVRAGQSNTQYAVPSCDCQQFERSAGLQQPCRHTLWLCDQFTSQMRPHQVEPLTLMSNGYSAEADNVCNNIPDFHFDVLADSLGCDVSFAGQSAQPSPRRVQTVREILASLNEVPVERYRLDLKEPDKGPRAVKRGDLEQTIYRMLLRNKEFFSYFLASMRDYDLLNPRFRRFRDRADAALAGLDDYATDPSRWTAFGAKDVEWCARKLIEIEGQIKSMIFVTDSELPDYDHRAAARTLVHILKQVVLRKQDVGPENTQDNTRNLYQRLIGGETRLVGGQARRFVIDLLGDIPNECVNHLVDELNEIERIILQDGAPPSYVERLRELISRLRNSKSGSASGSGSSSKKRPGQAPDRRSKRMK